MNTGDVNPYILRGMIPLESDMFFGREKELKRITGILSGDNPQSVSIIGERRIGKSSLAMRVYGKLIECGDTLVIFLDCNGLAGKCDSSQAFFQAAARCFAQVPGKEPGLKKVLKGGKKGPFKDYDSFLDFLEGCAGGGVKTVIILDEFEHLPEMSFADDNFFSHLRSAANNPGHGLAFVTVSRRELRLLTHRAVVSSNFWNIFHNEPVGLLDRESILDLRRFGFARAGFSVTGAEEEKLGYYGGDFPFFNQCACDFLWEAKSNGEEPDWRMLEGKLFSFYQKLWQGRGREEQEVLRVLLEKNDCDRGEVLTDLLQRGVVTHEEGLYLPFCEHFGRLMETSFIEKSFPPWWKRVTLRNILSHLKEALGIVKDAKALGNNKENQG